VKQEFLSIFKKTAIDVTAGHNLLTPFLKNYDNLPQDYEYTLIPLLFKD